MSDSLERNETTIVNECYLINKGIRSCASLTIGVHGSKDDSAVFLYQLEQIVLSHGLHSVAFELPRGEDDSPDDWFFDFWVYSYPHQLPVINAIQNVPRSFLREWAIGKLLGYSDQSMEDYLSRFVMKDLDVDTKPLEKED